MYVCMCVCDRLIFISGSKLTHLTREKPPELNYLLFTIIIYANGQFQTCTSSQNSHIDLWPAYFGATGTYLPSK